MTSIDSIISNTQYDYKKENLFYKIDVSLSRNNELQLTISLDGRVLTYEEHIEFQNNHPDKILEVIQTYKNYLLEIKNNKSNDLKNRLRNTLNQFKQLRNKK